MIAVTREHQIRAQIAGACCVPREGTRLDRLTAEQLVWVDDAGLLTAAEERAVWEAVSDVRMDLRATPPPPLALLARSGCSDGYGHGDGFGYGHGDGFGDGLGYGSGDGYGYGYGLGLGYGYGYDDGNGYGYGDGNGYGYDGDGDGYGYGDGFSDGHVAGVT